MADATSPGLSASSKRVLPPRKVVPAWAPRVPRDRLLGASPHTRSAPLAHPPPKPSKPVKRRLLPEVERVGPDPREDA